MPWIATAPPDGDPGELWAALWLDRLVGRILNEPGCNLTWPDAAQMHPAAELALDDECLAALVPDRLVDLGRTLAAVTTWSHLRTRCAEGAWPLAGITASDAAWMDDGMFARWALTELPSIGDLLEPLEALLPPATTCLVIDNLVAWDLL